MLSGTQRRSRARPKKERDRVVVAIAKLLRMFGVIFLYYTCMKNKWVYWAVGFLLLGGIGWWIYRGFSTPLPGEAVSDLGQKHVLDISTSTYNSNPPTSGDHFPVWAKPGFYNQLISDGHLIHSMEHGYVIVWYDCTKPVQKTYGIVNRVEAHAGIDDATIATDSAHPLTKMTTPISSDMSAFTPENSPAKEVELPKEFEGAECKTLTTALKGFLRVEKRVIIAPRVGMDIPIALTAWNRILGLNRVEKEKIEGFIRAFHNRGPEKTVE